MNNSQEQIQAQLLMSDEDLFILLGSNLGHDAAFPPSPKRFAQLGRHWLSEKRSELAKIVCSNKRLQVLASLEAPTQENITLIGVLADVIAANVAGVPAVTIAILLARHGLRQLCKESWK